MIKLFLDWPIGYINLKHGDGTFVLAQCYLDSEYYRRTITSLQKEGREILLDNGAWEFGKSMEVPKYRKICKNINPDYVVIPDTLEDLEATVKSASEFLEYWKPNGHTKTLLVPQGKGLKEIVKCYNILAEQYADKIDMLAISKWQCKIMNRIALVDHLWNNAKVKFTDVHFLGFQNFDELFYKEPERRLDGEFPHQWLLRSIDTRFPIKKAFGNVSWRNELDYYNTKMPLGVNAIEVASTSFQKMLSMSGW